MARLAAELEAEFQRLGPDTVAAFLAEPVVGATAGCVPAPEAYFRAVRDICNRHGALLILDEVMCGMGRTGTRHAWEQEGIAPDIQAVAKGLGGGYQPIGAMLASGQIIDTIRQGSGAFLHGHTYLAHPMACAAALEVQKIISEERLLDRVKERGAQLERRLTERFGNHRHVGDIRGRGLFQAIELVADRATRTPFDPALKLNGGSRPSPRRRAGLLPGRRNHGRPQRRSCPARATLHRDVRRYRYDRRQAGPRCRQRIENGWSLGGSRNEESYHHYGLARCVVFGRLGRNARHGQAARHAGVRRQRRFCRILHAGLPGQLQGPRCRLLPRAGRGRARRPQQGALRRAHRAEPLLPHCNRAKSTCSIAIPRRPICAA